MNIDNTNRKKRLEHLPETSRGSGAAENQEESSSADHGGSESGAGRSRLPGGRPPAVPLAVRPTKG